MTLAFLSIGLLVGGGAVLLWARGAIGAREARIAALDGQLALAEQSQGQWEDRFKVATGDALLKSQASLLALTEAKLAPIKETLQKFEVQSKALEDRHYLNLLIRNLIKDSGSLFYMPMVSLQ